MAISAGMSSSFKIQGWSGFVPPLYRREDVNEVLTVKDDEPLRMTLRLAGEEGIFTGVSGGANVSAAVRLAARFPPTGVVVTLAPDSGCKYLASEPYQDVTP